MGDRRVEKCCLNKLVNLNKELIFCFGFIFLWYFVYFLWFGVLVLCF